MHITAPFLGKRTYIHSTTLIEEIFKVIGVQRVFTLKCAKKITNPNLNIVFGDVENSSASFYWGENECLGVVEVETQTSTSAGRVSPYDFLNGYEISGNMLKYAQPGKLNYLCSAIALNRFLLSSSLGEGDSQANWFVGQLTVEDYRRQWQNMNIYFRSSIAEKLYLTDVLIDEDKVAEILFWKNKPV